MKGYLSQLGPNIFCGMAGIIQYLRMHGLLASAMARHRHCNYKPTKHLEMGFTLKLHITDTPHRHKTTQLTQVNSDNTAYVSTIPITAFIMDENMFEES